MLNVNALRTKAYKPCLFWFCVFALFWATCLLFAGGFTTSIRAGMAFLDWPLSNGSLNPDGWLTQEDQLAEHSHRLLGMKIGLLSIVLFLWIHLREARSWVRRLSRLLLWVVILQGVLGGARVRLDQANIFSESNLLAQSFAVLHACGAQITLCLLVSLAVTCSRYWIESPPYTADAKTRHWGWAAVGVLFIQLLLGAVMRHSDAALAIPTFPLTPEGHLYPTHWSFPVAIHYAHRLWAFAVVAVLAHALAKTIRSFGLKSLQGVVAVIVCFLVSIQVFLGALVVWSSKNPYSATVHMLVGAFLLASVWMLAFLSIRSHFLKSPICLDISSISTSIHESTAK
jgi:cytochrome c oxidase assembly protein subunit 15